LDKLIKTESNKRKSMSFNMRSLHRDIGFFVIGITIIYCISGVLLVFRDSDFLKHEVNTERQVRPNLSESDLGMILHQMNFKVFKTEGDIMYFQNGTYNKATGIAKYKEKVLPEYLGSTIKIHKVSSRSAMIWISVMYGVLLLFLAISSFWMFKSKTKLFRRGVWVAIGGCIVAVILLAI
jgi:hypothetical protein